MFSVPIAPKVEDFRSFLKAADAEEIARILLARGHGGSDRSEELISWLIVLVLTFPHSP